MKDLVMWRRLAAELLGTFFLVLVGCGAVAVNDVTGGELTHLGVALCWGLVVTVMIYTVGETSGAHINPAVTVGFAVAQRFPWRDVVPYVLAQSAGAILGAATLRMLFGVADTKLGTTLPAGSWQQSFALEVLMTWLLMVVILRVAGGRFDQFAGMIIGGVIAMEAAFGGPISGASMNPARSFGPALLSGQLASLWVYVAAPVLGAVVAVPTCWLLASED